MDSKANNPSNILQFTREDFVHGGPQEVDLTRLAAQDLVKLRSILDANLIFDGAYRGAASGLRETVTIQMSDILEFTRIYSDNELLRHVNNSSMVDLQRQNYF